MLFFLDMQFSSYDTLVLLIVNLNYSAINVIMTSVCQVLQTQHLRLIIGNITVIMTYVCQLLQTQHLRLIIGNITCIIVLLFFVTDI